MSIGQEVAQNQQAIVEYLRSGLFALLSSDDATKAVRDYRSKVKKGGRPPTNALPEGLEPLYSAANWYGNAVAYVFYDRNHEVAKLLLAAERIRDTLERPQELGDLILGEGERVFARRRYVEPGQVTELPSITSGLRTKAEVKGLAKKYGAEYKDIVKLSQLLQRNDHFWFYQPFYKPLALAHTARTAPAVARAAGVSHKAALAALRAAYLPVGDAKRTNPSEYLLGKTVANYKSIIALEKPRRGEEDPPKALLSPTGFAKAGAAELLGEEGVAKLKVLAWSGALADLEVVKNDVLDDAVANLLKQQARDRARAGRQSSEELKSGSVREARKAKAIQALLQNPDADISRLVGGDGQLRRAVMRQYETLSTMRDTVIDARAAQARADRRARERESDRILGVHTRAYAQEAADAIARPVRNDNRPLLEDGAGVLSQPEGVYCAMRRNYINVLRLDPSQRPQPGRYRNMAIMEPNGSKARAVIDIDLSVALFNDLLESEVAYYVLEGTFDDLSLSVRGEPLRGEQARRVEEFDLLQNQGRRIREAKAQGYVFKGIEGRLRDRMGFMAQSTDLEQMGTLKAIYRRLLPEYVKEIKSDLRGYTRQLQEIQTVQQREIRREYESVVLPDLQSDDVEVKTAAQQDLLRLAAKAFPYTSFKTAEKAEEAMDKYMEEDLYVGNLPWEYILTGLLGTKDWSGGLPDEKIQLLAQAIGIVPVVGVNVSAPNTSEGKHRLALAVALTCAEETKTGYEVTVTPDVALFLSDQLTDIGLEGQPYSAEAEEAATALRMAVERAKAPKDALGKDSSEGTFGTLGRKQDRYIGKTKLQEQNVIVELDDEGLVKVPRDKHAARGLGCYD